MKSIIKRMISMSLVVVLCLFAAACGGSGDSGSGGGSDAGGSGSSGEGANGRSSESSGEVATVNVTMPSIHDVSDAPEVQAAINAIIEEKYGVRMDLTYVAMGNWLDQSNLLLTGNEVDVIAFFQTPLTSYVNNGQAYDLTDYYANASDAFKAVWTVEELSGTTVNGSLYAIPNLRNFGNIFGLNVDRDIADEFGIEDGHEWTLDDVDTFLRQVKEAYPEKYAIVPQSSDQMASGWTWDGLGDGKYIGVITNRGQDTTVKNIFETEDFLNFVSYSRQWYVDGLMMQDCLSNTEAGATLVQAGKAVSYIDNYANNVVEGMIRTVIIDAWSVANSYSELCYGINALSSNPDAAWTMMEILYTDEEVSILLNNGIEGKHYVKNDDGTIAFPDGASAADVGYGMSDLYWVTPYSGNSLPIEYNGPTFFEDLIKFNKDTLKSKAHGFYFDTTEVVDQYSACSNIMDKYYKALFVGAVEVDETIAQANKELEAAGLQDIIDAKQAQLDAFLAQ